MREKGLCQGEPEFIQDFSIFLAGVFFFFEGKEALSKLGIFAHVLQVWWVDLLGGF